MWHNLHKSHLCVFVITLLVFTLMQSVNVNANNGFIYGGDSKMSNPPSFKFSLENETLVSNLGHSNVAFLVSVSAPDGMQTLGSALYSVSYKASWEDKHHNIYQWSMNNPKILSDDDPYPKMCLFYAIDLSNVPEGDHQIKVMVDGGGYLFGFLDGVGYYETFSADGSSTFHFSVGATPSSPTTSDSGNSSSVWDVQTIDTRGAGAYVFNSPLVVLDSNDMPHIVYSRFVDYPDSTTRFVMYHSWNGLCWSTQAVDVGTPYSFVLDENNTPHIVYGCISYATFDGTDWLTQTIESVGNNFGAIALDSSGTPCIAYTDGKSVKYATKIKSGWDIQTIDSLDPEYNVPFQVSLAIDQNDTPYILYGVHSSYVDKNTTQTYPTEAIKFAVYKNSSWNIETISLPNPINGYGNIVLDSKGYPHFICSQRLASKYPYQSDLLYVSWVGDEWTTQNVVSNVSLAIYGHNTNWVNMGFLALDSHDYPKICYTTNNLTYASWTGNSWNVQTIDTNAQSKPGFLSLDSNDNPHISYLGPLSPSVYLGSTYADVRYATSTQANLPVDPEMPTDSNQQTEALPLSTELIFIACSVAAIMLLLSYWVLQKRQQRTN